MSLFLSVPCYAARPLLDRHQWDAYFGLYARDSSVPWKAASVRLDTYSGAPVEFAAYNVDPADVIVAGQNRSPRALDTTHRQPVVHWRFSPPPGYRFESSDVTVPLGSQEGFFVVVARRGEAVQQVWLNRTHLGLLIAQTQLGLTLWGVDLRRGVPLANISVDFLVGLRLVRKRTNADGLIVWRDTQRPSFALAQSGAGRAFVSILPQAPPPPAAVAVRLESAVARAGSRFRFVGFARRRVLGIYRRASGTARISLVGHGTTLGSLAVPLDGGGAFSGEFIVPANAAAGSYAVLAAAAGGVGGTSLQVDAASDVTLTIAPTCPCDAARDVPLAVVARRGELPAAGVAVHVLIVRSPHVLPADITDASTVWGTTVVYDRTVRTGVDGSAQVVLPSPSDGLDSTYGIRATTPGASATSRVVVPNAPVALALTADAASLDTSEPARFTVRAFDPLTGAPAPGLSVNVQLSHGASAQMQTAQLDAAGRANIVFRETSLGSNLALASAMQDGHRALDATSVLVEPGALAGRTLSAEAGVTLATDRASYGPHDRVTVKAAAPGAIGDALVALTGSRTFAPQVSHVAHGTAQATLALSGAPGALQLEAAFVRNGAIALGAMPLTIDGPGQVLALDLSLDKPTYEVNEMLQVALHDAAGSGGATLAVRVADGPESAPAYFEDAPAMLAAGAANTQASSSDDPQWHAYVAPARSKANDIFAAEGARKVGNDLPTVGVAAPRTLYWNVARATGSTLAVPAPAVPGHYVLSVLRIADDGDLGAASTSFDVR